MEVNNVTSQVTENERLVWAIDGFSHRPELESAHLGWVEEFTGGRYAEIQPVFALDDVQIEKAWAHPDARRNLKEIVASAGLPRVRPEVILTDLPPPYFTERKAVQSVLRYAASTKSDVIVLHSHPVSKIRRMIAGTFVETMLQHSSVPLLVLTDHVEARRPIKQILFCLNSLGPFMISARRCFERAAQIGAEEVVILEIGPPTRDESLLRLIDKARRAGVRLSRVRGKGASNLTDQILGVSASEGIDLVVLPWPMDGSLTGYPTELLVESRQPIWVV